MPISQPLPVQLAEVTPANLQQLKQINISTLPVRYTEKFYDELLSKIKPEYLKFAFWNGFAVAAVCARVEPLEGHDGFFKLYIMTINVLAPYRRRGIASVLLNHVLSEAAKDETIIEAYLHVQTSNDEAKKFYESRGFVQTDIIPNYYHRIDPPDSFLLKKSLKEGHVVKSTIGDANLGVSKMEGGEGSEVSTH